MYFASIYFCDLVGISPRSMFLSGCGLVIEATDIQKVGP